MSISKQNITHLCRNNGKTAGQYEARNAGIELFRCVSMVLILILHILGRGGVIGSAGKGTAQFRTAWFLETLGYCSVDCYALISGFVNKEKEFRPDRFILRWLEVLFWLLIPLAVAKLFFQTGITDSLMLKSFLPMTKKTFWYFNAYALLFPFMPLLNIGLERIGKKNHLMIVCFLFVTTSVLHVINGGDDFVLSGGYCGMWLIILYVFGAYFRIYGAPKWAKWYVTVPVFLFSALSAWAMEMHKVDLTNAHLIEKSDAVWSALDRCVNYTSPFMVIMAVCLLLLFSNIKIKSAFAGKTVVLLGKCSFGVYLFHVGPVMWDNFMYQRYKSYASYSPAKLAVSVIVTALVLFVVFELASIVRYMIFKYCGINKAVVKLFNKSEKSA